ncbi:endonuclease/exonuclease/phosphatase family protein [Kordiimonas sp. SCSIO 12610]|uniref:endonuclease/exonuclease/phosphatase family protein n=1 Tax=Kordiimonas sp. SCSIO 12610 TaxID=2829597 RepID=UPI00210CD013|nr:endonuclease/exonuclease/phosphatase family protein [Kordiimonas sp. SCSIO 12610]UTW56472.1 endonuclease/exonuclease/phosphatase family protein [Kordiimonas sp. SCSIO 12610]
MNFLKAAVSYSIKALIILSALFVCIAIGEIYVGRDRSDAREITVPATNVKSLKILTYNVGLLEVKLLGFELFKPSDYLEERLQYLPDALKSTDADIIALQELYSDRQAEFVLDALSDIYPYHYHADNTLWRVQNGLMLLSKYPIRNTALIKMDDGPRDERYFASKSIMAAEVVLGPDLTVDIANIHPTGGGTELAQDHPSNITARGNQIQQTYDLLNEGEGLFQSDYKIIMGDFNAGPEIAEENYKLLANYGYVDAYARFANTHDEPLKITWDANNILNRQGAHAGAISQRIDHIFLSPDMASNMSVTNAEVLYESCIVPVQGGDLVPVSDHYGVMVELVLNT